MGWVSKTKRAEDHEVEGEKKRRTEGKKGKREGGRKVGFTTYLSGGTACPRVYSR